MKKDNKIILIIVGILAAIALGLLVFFGVHYATDVSSGLILPPDMKSFTVVNGGDYTSSEIADYMRYMHKQEKPYLRINDKLYAATAEHVYDNLDEFMTSQGFEYIGCDGALTNMRCFYREGVAIWIRVEYDLNERWCLWNLSDPFAYDLAKDGYKTMEY